MLGALKISYRFYSQIKISVKSSYNMEKCYLRYEKGHALFDLSFVYVNPETKIRRQFNFSRRTAESIEALEHRIAINVSKLINTKAKKKKPKEQVQMDQGLSVQVIENEVPIPKNLLCHDLLTKTGLQLKFLDQVYDIIINPPWVLSISLPSSLLSGFPVYPVNFKIQFGDKTHCSFVWLAAHHLNEKGHKISEEHIKWEAVGTGYTYVPSADAIGKKLKVECIPGDGLKKGPLVEAVSSSCVEAGPGRCPFENRHAFTTNKLSGKSFRVVSYNILADLYCDSDYTRTVLHPYCPPYALNIDYRKQLIIKELLGYNADIACLQEVDKKMFVHELKPVLSSDFFDGVFINKGKEVAEGLACFFRKDRFKLIDYKSMVFGKELVNTPCHREIWEAIKDNKPLTDRLLDRSTAGLTVILESVENSNHILVVGNTHLYFHPDADHIRLIQGGLMIYWVNEIVKDIQNENPGKTVSVVLCGDFNSVPSCGIYKLYTTGVAPSTLDDWKSNELEAVTGLTLTQNLLLGSACGTPQFTNYTDGFADCLDYIYYDKNNLQVEQVIPFPSEEELKEHTALPSVVFPSDHIALVADLNLIQ